MLLSNDNLLALARLPLRRVSHWRVYLAIAAHRYECIDNPVVNLSVAELAKQTGLAERTVKGALQALRRTGLIVREGRKLVLLPLPTPCINNVGFTSR